MSNKKPPRLPVFLWIAVSSFACGGGKRDMEKVCDAEARSGATVAGDRGKVLAWIDANTSGDPRQAARDAFAKPAAEAAAPLRAAAAKVGLASCPLADALGYEPPPTPSRIAPPRALEPIPNASPLGRLAAPTNANTGKVEASGAIAQDAANAAIESAQVRARLCYEMARKKTPRLSGRVKIELAISASGAVTAAKDAGSTIDADVVTCVRGVLASTKFASTGAATVTVTYDFVPDD